MSTTGTPFKEHLNKKTGIFYTTPISVAYIGLFALIPYIMAFVYNAQGDSILLDAARQDYKDIGLVIGVILTWIFIQNRTTAFDNIFTRTSSHDKFKELFRDQETFAKFWDKMESWGKIWKQAVFGLIISIGFIGTQLASIMDESYYWFDVQLFPDYTLLVYLVFVVMAIGVFFLSTWIYTYIGVAFFSVSWLGSIDRKDLRLYKMDNRDTEGGQSIIKYNQNLSVIGSYMFSVTLGVVIIALLQGLVLIFVVQTEQVSGLVNTILVIIAFIIFSFLPQWSIHGLLQEYKDDAVAFIDNQKEKIRIELYNHYLKGSDPNFDPDIAKSRMEFFDSQLEELNGVYPWLYDFAGVIRLIGGFATSLLLYLYQAYGAPLLESLQENLPS